MNEESLTVRWIRWFIYTSYTLSYEETTIKGQYNWNIVESGVKHHKPYPKIKGQTERSKKS